MFFVGQSFDSGNLEEITSKLVSMQLSLNVLSNTDDYEDKKMQLEGLKNRLEAKVSPLIVKAFTTFNLGKWDMAFNRSCYKFCTE